MQRLSSRPSRAAEILLVEDDEGDALLTEKAFLKGGMPINLHVAVDGYEALQFLRKEGAYQNAPRPDLILLDLNLPGMHGSEVLRMVKEHLDWRRIPIVVLTSSKAESDILSAHNLYCNAYMVKPGTPAIFEQLAQNHQNFWFRFAQLPHM